MLHARQAPWPEAWRRTEARRLHGLESVMHMLADARLECFHDQALPTVSMLNVTGNFMCMGGA